MKAKAASSNVKRLRVCFLIYIIKLEELIFLTGLWGRVKSRNKNLRKVRFSIYMKQLGFMSVKLHIQFCTDQLSWKVVR